LQPRGIAWVLGYTIAAEIGEISRLPSPRKLIGYTGLTPTVEQSGERDRRGPLRKNGPNYLRWALIDAAHNAGRYHPTTGRSSSGCAPATGAAAARRSPRSRFAVASARRSGTCSAKTAPSLRQAPQPP
jgi:transposase